MKRTLREKIDRKADSRGPRLRTPPPPPPVQIPQSTVKRSFAAQELKVQRSKQLV
jgi:hypothetical protein